VSPKVQRIHTLRDEAKPWSFLARIEPKVEQVPRHYGLSDTRAFCVLLDAQAFLSRHQHQRKCVL
jgi:hypothetical protein